MRKFFKRIQFVLLLSILPGCIQTPVTSVPFPDTPVTHEDVFTILFIGDSEPRMRDNTDDELKYYVSKLIELKTSHALYFDIDGGTHRIFPELVMLGGDISADRTTSIHNDSAIWQPLYDNNILFIAGFGNHDWEPKMWSDSSLGYSAAGHQSNEDTKAFCTWTYKKSAAVTPNFLYKAIEPVVVTSGVTTGGPRNFYATYKGVSIVNFNTFLYQPSYQYPAGWPVSCNLATGGAGCETFVSAASQILKMESVMTKDTNRTILFFQHYPMATGDEWWSDYNASNTTLQQKKDTLMSMVAKYKHSAFFAGHNHSAATNIYMYNNRQFSEYIAPYFGGWGGDDRTQGGGFLAVLVSSTRGILEVKRIDAPL